MSSIVREINCPHCGAPLRYNPGEIVGLCSYCGYTSVLDTGKSFTLEHAMLINRFTPDQALDQVRSWMGSGFMKPNDLVQRSKIREGTLNYLPFWIVRMNVTTSYKGIFERMGPGLVKEGKIDKDYDWLVLGRRRSEFPTREYDVPLAGKIPFDFRRIESFGHVLNSELSQIEAVDMAKQQVGSHHEYLAKQDVDRIVEINHEVEIEAPVFLHAPIWFFTYEYRNGSYSIFLDGVTGSVVKGDIPPAEFKLF